MSSLELLKSTLGHIPEKVIERVFREKEKGCVLCGSRTKLQFHHKNPRNKSFEISDKEARRSLEEWMREIDKCVVLCESCHRLVHKGSRRPYSCPNPKVFAQLWDMVNGRHTK